MEETIANLYSLKNKTALITGASAGLGYDMACALAEAGCHIIITSRSNSGKMKASTQEIHKKYKVDTLGVTMNQNHYSQVKEAIQTAHQWKGKIDILINNAGGGSGASEGNLFKRNPEDIADLIATNLTGAIYCCKEVGKLMADQGFGKIINIASVAGIVGRDRKLYKENDKMQQPIDYAAAKAGVIGMTRDLAAFVAPYGVHANCISPGGFDRGEPRSFVKSYGNITALGRMGKMGKDIKGVALFLASSASDYVTGQNIIVDGGMTIWK